MTRTALVGVGLAALSLIPSPSAAADRPTFVIGARVSCDLPGSLSDTGACPGVEVFGHIALAPRVTLDASLGYRQESYWSGSPSVSTWRFTQYPLLLGVSYAFTTRAPVRPFLAAGVLFAPSTASYEPPSRFSDAVSGSTTSLTFGGFGAIGLHAAFGSSLRLEAQARYVFNPIHANEYVGAHEEYPVLLVGVGHAF